VTRWTCSGRIEHAHTGSPDSATYSANPRPTARACTPVNFTAGRFRAHLVASRWTRACGRRASEHVSSVLVAVPPARNSSHAPTNSDHDPRGSFGSQNPEALKMAW
jgi:hypothetical protein